MYFDVREYAFRRSRKMSRINTIGARTERFDDAPDPSSPRVPVEERNSAIEFSVVTPLIGGPACVAIGVGLNTLAASRLAVPTGGLSLVT